MRVNSALLEKKNLLPFFQNQLFSKISVRNTIRVSNSLDPDQARPFVNEWVYKRLDISESS